MHGVARLGPQAQRVYETLRGSIEDGTLPPGGRLAPQDVLAREHGVALMTLRQALKRLMKEGFVSARQGQGTFVRSSAERMLKTDSILDSIVGGGNFPAALRVCEGGDRFREAFEASSIPMALGDLAANGHGLVANGAWMDLTGYTPDDLETLTPWAASHPEDAGLNWRLARAIDSGSVDYGRIEKRLVRKDGEVIWVDLIAHLIRDRSGQPRLVLNVLSDVSLRKRTEELLETLLQRVRPTSGGGLYMKPMTSLVWYEP
jgi:PAS domain S-box-containing protein